MDDRTDSPALDAAHAAAKQLAAGDWQLDGDPEENAECGMRNAESPAPEGRPPPALPPSSIPHSTFRIPHSSESPPSPEQIAEVMLFVGGPPLTADTFAAAVRVPADVFRSAIDGLSRKYKAQNRPYTIQPRGGGYVLAVKPAFAGLRAKLAGGPREARLSQPALDVLSLVAYRQPIPKAEIDALRGHDSGSQMRQLVRLGLVAVTRRGSADAAVGYGTTPRFLTLFGLTSLDDLPRLGDAQQL